MKGHKGHHHEHSRAEHAKGGAAESPMDGDKIDDEHVSEVYAGKGSKVHAEADERKRGGKAKKKIGKAEGMKSMARGDRKPRKSGGRAGADQSPLSSAHKADKPTLRKDLELN